jgi:hypothetical protein
LFERESVQRHIKKSGAAREEIAADVEGRVGAGCWWDGGNTSDTLTKCGANGAQRMPDKDNFGAVLQPFDQQQNGAYGIGQVGSTRLAREHKGPTDLVAVPVMSMDEECNPGIEIIGPIIRGGGGGRHDCVAVPYTKAKRAQSDTDDETWVEGQVNPTLSLFDCGDVRATTAIAIPILPQAMQADGWRVGKENKDGRGNGLGVGKDGDPCPTLDRSAVPAVAIQGSMIGRQDHNGPAGSGCSSGGEMFTLTSTDIHAVAFPINTMTLGGRPDEANDRKMTMGVGADGDPQFTLQAAHSHAVAQAIPIDTMKIGGRIDEENDKKLGWGIGVDGDPQFTLLSRHSHAVGTDIHSCVITGDVAATMGTKGSAVNGHGPTLMQAMTVRRLTPRECERLQGFPDDYTLIPWRKKAAEECPDGPRYKALGNSMAVNCMEWIGERIAALEAEKGTT